MGEAAEYGDPAAAAFSEAIDDTYESRASTREKAWEAMVALLRNNVRSDDCYQRWVWVGVVLVVHACVRFLLAGRQGAHECSHHHSSANFVLSSC